MRIKANSVFDLLCSCRADPSKKRRDCTNWRAACHWTTYVLHLEAVGAHDVREGPHRTPIRGTTLEAWCALKIAQMRHTPLLSGLEHDSAGSERKRTAYHEEQSSPQQNSVASRNIPTSVPSHPSLERVARVLHVPGSVARRCAAIALRPETVRDARRTASKVHA
jgi:hypothetical protein